MAIPDMLAFSPDDRLITYLLSPDRSLRRLLYAFDPHNDEQHWLPHPPDKEVREENLTLAEKLWRERKGQLELGVTQYSWAPRLNRLLISFPDGLYVKGEEEQAWHKIADSRPSPCLDARFSPSGERVAYVQDAELYVVSVDGGAPRQITQGARGLSKTHGLAEHVAQDEIMRGGQGYWWSPDGRYIAFIEIDEAHIPIYRILHQGKGLVGENAQEDHHYPFAGQANVRVRLGVISAEGGDPVWMDLGEDQDIYLGRVCWLTDGALCAQIENRQQTGLELARFDPHTGQRTTLLRESSTVWINLHNMFHPLGEKAGEYTGGFIWASERGGYRHLYLFDCHGELIRPLTSGEWIVDVLCGVDEERQQVYFTASLESPLESQLYAVSFRGEKPRRITTQSGTHTVTLDHNLRRFIDVYDTLDQPPTVTLRSLEDGSLLSTIYADPDPRVQALKLTPPEIVTLPNRDGVELFGALFRPSERFGSGPYPTVVFVYGGPTCQLVANSWRLTGMMRSQYLCSRGFLVFVLDNRGGARRGLAFEAVIKNDMGHLEVEDQVDGVQWLVNQGLADARRVGINGGSYGGYMAAMCLARAPQVFRAAVAMASVTHWDGYETHYTERYMGMPQTNPQGYESSSVMAHVMDITGSLLLMHGLIDENVHFRHTARLINSLIANRKPYELIIYPDGRHMLRKLEDRVFMEEQLMNFFVKNLMLG